MLGNMAIQRMDNIVVVVDNLEAATADSYRLCYVRGPEGNIVALAEQID
jgi:hypothetical protein